MDIFIHETARIINSQYREVKLFRNVLVRESTLGDKCSVGDDTVIERCFFENNVIINRRSYINDSFIGSYCYSGINTTMNWTKMGKFCSLARNVDIGGFNHDYHKITTMPEFRFVQMLNGGGEIPNNTIHNSYCEIGNDVWIAAGAQVLHKVKVGDGAVIGAGAVVTHDVPSYSIVAGVPARIIGYRCNPELIEELLRIKWWNWHESIIIEHQDLLLHENICEENIEKMKSISKE
jgi:acetyltransferase-like isoleucine patch superfamily enzyme